jgi:hypothetical protein
MAREELMNAQELQLADLGLQHVLENGLAVLRNDEVRSNSRSAALQRLSKILDEADRGSTLVSSSQFFLGKNEQPALESFSKVLRYLKDFAGDIPSYLTEARRVVSELERGENPDHQALGNAESLLQALLKGLEEERHTRPLVTMQERVFL